MKTIRTRIAPSPTGFPHIGTIYQALFDFAYARKYKGSFVCRIEDTDRVRFVEGAEKVIYDALEWFGLNPDESPKHGGIYKPYRQSERLDIYKKYAEELIKKGHAYYCFCTKNRLEKVRAEQIAKKIPPMYDKHCLSLSKDEVDQKLSDKTSYVIRMNVPKNRKVSFHDVIIGTIEFESSSIDDQVLIKSDGFPTYHLAVVVDDHLMKISHIFRGKEWISSTPKHVLLYEFFGWNTPVHGHLPLILNTDGKGKLSKRHGHASVDYYKQEGFLPEAILNYLSNIIGAFPEEKDIYSLDEFISKFEIEKISSQGARFDVVKLEWMNGEYIRLMKKEDLIAKIIEYLKSTRHSRPFSLPKMTDENLKLIKQTIPLIQERIKKLSDYWPMGEFFFTKPNEFEMKVTTEWVSKVIEGFQGLSKWDHNEMYKKGSEIAQELNISKSKLFMDIRIAITGKKIGPPLFESMEVLGKKESIERMESVSSI